MKKEVLVAILLGLGIGVIVTFAVYSARRALVTQTENPRESTGPAAVQTRDLETETKHSLTITSPSEGSIESTEKITLSGTTTPKSTVAVTGGETDVIIDADETGQFSAEIILVGGDNQIRVTGFSPGGEKAEAVLTVVYSTAEF